MNGNQIPTGQDYLPQLMLDSQICFPLYACARKIVNQYTPYLKPLGLTYTQYLVFLALWETGEANVGELGRKLYLDCGTLTPLLKKMQDHGWIERRRSREDERIVHVTLTESGWALRDQVREIPMKIGMCIKMEPGEALTLYRLLRRLMADVPD